MRFRFRAPLAANPRMENFFERVFLRAVCEDYRSKSHSIQVAVGKNLISERANQLAPNLFKLHQFARGPIRIEKSRSRQNIAQTFAEGRFPG